MQINFKDKNWYINHDLGTPTGRFMHWAFVADPRKSFYSASGLAKIKADLENAELRAADGVGTFSNKEKASLLYKKRVTLSCIHPDSGEIIPWFARTSAFIPANLPIIAAMMLSAPTPFNTVFWQWVNQTYNAGFNYGNRNASS